MNGIKTYPNCLILDMDDKDSRDDEGSQEHRRCVMALRCYLSIPEFPTVPALLGEDFL